MGSRSWWLCALAAVALAGCAPLSVKRIQRADAVIAASVDRRQDCHAADACAQPSPFLDQARAALAQADEQHPHNAATLLEVGEDALVARINLIRAARKSIDIQTYIWAGDDAGLLVLDELVNAARRGVKVRILADQLGSLNDPKLLSRLARASVNLEIRLYNPTFDKAKNNFAEYTASVLCCFKRFNQRMHNKLFLVDDEVGITGGRNYEDRYYDWDPQLDFLDRDALIAGTAAHQMAASFDLFWDHPRAVPLTHLKDANARILDHPRDARPWVAPVYGDPARVARVQAQAEDPAFLREHFTDASLQVGRVDYFYDLPSKTRAVHGRDARELTRDLMLLLRGAQHEVVLQTPYLVLTKRAGEIFESLQKKNPPVHVLVSTNSLASTDAMGVYALSYKHRKKFLVDYGFDLHELKPHPLDAPLMIANYLALTGENAAASMGGRHGVVPIKPEDFGPRVSLHAKSLVVDGEVAMVGSHNFDPRSANYNTEAGVIVYDPKFAAEVRASIVAATQPQNAWLIAPRDPIPVIGDVSNVIGSVSRQLPIFDLWPFDYATSYELKPGCDPLPPTDPNFLKCYRSVGDFPEVNLSLTAIITRFITAFGAGVQGIM
ncbi:MAG: phospholipase D family protein [Proteobacteria bacterium]|nr:phospholipase D family protein [Pseudomonadota bacterium]